MKISQLLIYFSGLISIAGFAEPVMLDCDFAKAFAPSAKMVELTKFNKAVAHCSSEVGTYEIAFSDLNFKVTAAEIELHSANLTVKCTGNAPEGVYQYGGMPAGFNSPKTPWFYNSAPGRCFLEGNDAITNSLEAEKNKSSMVLLPLITSESRVIKM